MLGGKKLETIGYDDVRTLIELGHREDREIDYKRELPALDGKRPDDARKELLKDASAFANAGGGDILFGIDEGRDEGKPNGVPIEAPGVELTNRDALERRWVEILDYGLDPRMVPKVRVRVVDVPGGSKKIVLLRVPRSNAAPHMVRETGWFYSRPGPLSSPMSTSEIRAAFEFSEGWATRVRSFRDERLGRLIGGDKPIGLHGGDSLLILHMVPFTSGSRGTRVDLHSIRKVSPMPVRNQSYASTVFNADGLLIKADESHDGSTAYCYTQYFRDGRVEFVVSADAATQAETVVLEYVEQKVVDAITKIVPVLVQAGAAYPFAIVFALTGVRGKWAYLDPRHLRNFPQCSRDLLCMDDVVVEDETGPEDLDKLFRPVFDSMWQCFGLERSRSYDANGKRKEFR